MTGAGRSRARARQLADRAHRDHRSAVMLLACAAVTLTRREYR